MEKVSTNSMYKLIEESLLLPTILLPMPPVKDEPSPKERIFLTSPHMSDEGFEQKYVKEAFDTNWVAPIGKNLDVFES